MATGGDSSPIISRQTDNQGDENTQNFSNKELEFVVIGKTGTGISFTANAILNKTYFTSKASKRSITTELRHGESISIKDGMEIGVFDTPGMFNTCLSKGQVKSNLQESLKCVSTGPFALIYVVPLRGQTDEDRITIKEMIEVFGDEMYRSIIIVFTDSKISDVLNNCTLQEYLKDMPDYINDLIDRCEHRYIALSFDGHGNENNMIKLFSYLQKMPVSRSYYKCGSYTQRKHLDILMQLSIGKHLDILMKLRIGKQLDILMQLSIGKSQCIGLIVVVGAFVYDYLTNKSQIKVK